MLFENLRHRAVLRWLALPPVAVVAAVIAFNFVAPFRLMQEGLWPADGGTVSQIGVLTVDALLVLAPLLVVVVLAAWLTAPYAKIRTVQVTAGLIIAICAVVAVLQLGVGQWYGAMVFVFGILATGVTALLILRFERQQAAEADADAETAAGSEPGETAASRAGARAVAYDSAKRRDPHA